MQGDRGAGYWTHIIKLANYHVRIIEVTVKLAAAEDDDDDVDNKK